MTHPWSNTTSRYGLVAIVLHWSIAVAITGMLVLGEVMTQLEPGDRLKFTLYQWHKSFGLLVFALSLARLGWRLIDPPPPWPVTMAGWERTAAGIVHAMLYVLMLALPISGWLLVSASPWNIPTAPFGLFTLPHLSWLADHPDKPMLEAAFKQLHAAGALSFTLLLLAHVAAALRHHLIVGDQVLTRMLPWTTRPSPPANANDGANR